MDDVGYDRIESVRPARQICESRGRQGMKIFFIAAISIGVGFVIGLLVFKLHYPQPDDGANQPYEKLSRVLQKSVNFNFLESQLGIFAGEMHQMGSARNFFLADAMRRNWTAWGLQAARIYNYSVQATAPPEAANPSVVRLLERESGRVVLTVSTTEGGGALPLYHSYSAAGRARGRLVFINYGLATDLALLDRHNVSYCGPGVVPVARLGFSVRSAKVKALVRRCGGYGRHGDGDGGGGGAANLPGAMLLYPDPWDFSVDPANESSTPDNTPVYPHSWWLPGDAAVFGNMKMRAGLQSPGLPSLDGVFATVNFSAMETPFPVQPISYDDARAVFRHFSRTPVPPDWAGRCLPPFLESSPEILVDMDIRNRVSTATMSNVVGWIPGSVDRDRYVLLGNHRDAWVTGASDPGSGSVILQQVVAILGNAYKTGLFKPLRSILFASWDGEENGLLGSSEFTNQFSSELKQRCIAYINMDCPIKGFWSFNGRATPLMTGPMVQSARNVWVNTTSTLFEDWREKKPGSPNKTEPKVSFLGGGSDHIPFAYVLGIPSAYPEYSFQQHLANMPAYHTRYDNIDMMLKWVDPGLEHHQLVSKFVLDYVIRLSAAPLIPYELDRLVNLLVDSFPELRAAVDSVPFVKSVNYSSILEEQLMRFRNSTVQFQARAQLQSNLNDASRLRKLNDVLSQLPRMFVTRDGLPTRPYLRNILLAPRLSNSYLGSVFTGVYDAIDLLNRGSVDMSVVLRQLSLLSNCLRKATDLLNGGLVDVMD